MRKRGSELVRDGVEVGKGRGGGGEVGLGGKGDLK